MDWGLGDLRMGLFGMDGRGLGMWVVVGGVGDMGMAVVLWGRYDQGIILGRQFTGWKA